ncbi:hypothetical protein CRG98_047855 [Punica granatum]|uniref:Uncharacterized protein n=1 Tax=Punica granatum TaxID=22663 RepID=A0A2I0HJ97_PUNGR|nr:hypothetical protein CRG98_047855 [Punica granatum]
MAGLQRSAVSFRRQGSSLLRPCVGRQANKPKDPDSRKEPSRDSEKLSRTACSPLPPIETAALERNHNYNHT